jgi:Domain of unknown function (DUF397)
MNHSALTWRKSSRSGAAGGENTGCVEVACLGGPPQIRAYRGGPTVSGAPAGFAVRDSKSSSPAFLTFPTGPWTAFLGTMIDS